MRDVLYLIFIIILGLSLSWATTIAVLWLIALIFGIKYSLIKATGIWLILHLLSSFLKSSKN